MIIQQTASQRRTRAANGHVGGGELFSLDDLVGDPGPGKIYELCYGQLPGNETL